MRKRNSSVSILIVVSWFLLMSLMFIFSADAETVAVNPISNLDRATVKEDCKTARFEQWGNKYNLIKILLNEDMEAYDYLASQPSNSVSDGVMKRLLDEWYPNMNLIKILYNIDMKAYKDLQ